MKLLRTIIIDVLKLDTSTRTKCFFFLLFFNVTYLFSQNVGINTTGATPAATNMLEVLLPSTLSGASTIDNSVAFYAASSHTHNSGIGYGIWAQKTGAGTGTTTNVAGYFSASGATNNYAIIIPSGGGNVGIGTTVPTATLEIVSPASITNAQTITANSITSGTGLGISSSSAALTGDILKIESTSDNGAVTGTGLKIAVTGISSAGVPMKITNQGTGNTLEIHDDGSFSDLTPFVIANNGRTGIGTSSPLGRLHVVGSSFFTDNMFVGYGAASSQTIIVGHSRTGDNPSVIELVSQNLGTTYDARFLRNSGANGTTCLDHKGTGDLLIRAINNASIKLQTQLTDRMTIDGSGNVGIGTVPNTNAMLSVAGSVSLPISTKTANYTITASDYIITAAATTTNVTITLPSAATRAGIHYIIKAVDITNTVAIATTSGQTIDGALPPASLALYETWTLVSDGGNWIRID